MDENIDQALRPVFLVLSRELEGWAAVTRGLEDRLSRLANGASMTDADIRAIQDLDLLNQHLGQLSRFCGDMADAKPVSIALDRLNLSGLKARMSGAANLEPASGEAEIW